MKVIAAPGRKCPKEGKPREYIGDGEAVDVPETAYYRRLVADGSLVIQVSEGKAVPYSTNSLTQPLNRSKEARDGQ